jgi:RNA polymerase sigma-32 factor
MERRLAHSDLSMDAPARDDGGTASFGDFIAGAGDSAETIVSNADMHEVFRRHIELFSADANERELAILSERILAEEPKTLQELGDQFGLTRERVRQLEKQLVNRLREYLKENLVDFDYWSPES